MSAAFTPGPWLVVEDDRRQRTGAAMTRPCSGCGPYYPVIGDVTGIAPVWGTGPIAVFFSYSDAADFINEQIGTGRGYLYIGESLGIPIGDLGRGAPMNHPPQEHMMSNLSGGIA